MHGDGKGHHHPTKDANEKDSYMIYLHSTIWMTQKEGKSGAKHLLNWSPIYYTQSSKAFWMNFAIYCGNPAVWLSGFWLASKATCYFWNISDGIHHRIQSVYINLGELDTIYMYHMKQSYICRAKPPKRDLHEEAERVAQPRMTCRH